jgi:hypothetical protein
MRPVHIFTIKPSINPVDINTIYSELGSNIPYYCPLEGNSIQYLICVDINTDFKTICMKYNYTYSSVYEYEVDDNMFNKDYQIHINYFDNNKPYILIKM